MKKKLISLIAFLFIFTLPLTLFACNGNDNYTSLLDIYKNQSSFTEFKGYKTEMTLPLNWSVATSAKDFPDSDLGYISSLNAFVITNKTDSSDVKDLSIQKCGTSEPMFPASAAIVAIRVVGDLIAAKSRDGSATVYNSNGRIVLSRTRIGDAGSLSIDSLIKILDDGLIAVNGTYEYSPKRNSDGSIIKIDDIVQKEKTGVNGYTSIFRPTTSGDSDDRGELVARVKNELDSGASNSSPLKNVRGFDKRYVSVTENKTKTTNKIVNRMFTVPYSASSAVGTTDGTSNGVIMQNDTSDYFAEITYLGNGRFLVHEDWTVGSNDNYTYYDGTDYTVLDRRIYHAEMDMLTPYVSNKVFLNITNNYYKQVKGAKPTDKNDPKNMIDASSFLNDGYMYASFGLVIFSDKTAVYDQFILDSGLNVVLSLSGNFGVELQNQTFDNINAFDLIMDFVDGYGYMPINPSSMRVYDKNGKEIFSNSESSILTAGANNGMIIASAEVDEETVYGGFDMNGKVKIPFKYKKLDPFRGFYTIGEIEGKNVLIGKDGKEVETLSNGKKALYDIATTSGGTEIHKMGCYMFYVDTQVGGQTVRRYGIKNLNADVDNSIIMPATMVAGTTLYAPINSPQDVFVFEKITSSSSDNTYTYKIYRLI